MARHLFDGAMPPLGPQLLAGGRTFGAAVYWLYRPFLSMSDDPVTLAILNKALYLLSAIALWTILRRQINAAAAFFALLAFVGSAWIVGLAYWPIHPNMSLFFSFLYLALMLRGFADQRRASLAAGSLLLGFLVQLHFSYYLLLIPQIALIASMKNVRRGRLTALCLAIFLLPLLHYLFWELANGFPNLRQVLEHPRFQKAYVPFTPLLNGTLSRLLPDWFYGMDSRLWYVRTGVVVVALLTGVAYSVRSMAGSQVPESKQSHKADVSVIAGAYFILPLGVLVASGSGYAQRHMLLLVPAAFVLLGIGFDRLIGNTKATRTIMAAVLIAILAADWCTALANHKGVKAAASGLGEWAKDYDNRKAVARYLISQMHVSPERYQRSAYWWWEGWAMDPEIYRDTETAIADHVGPYSGPPGDFDYLLLVDAGPVPPFLDSAFKWEQQATIGNMSVLRAWPKLATTGIPFTGNARTCTRLSPTERTIDFLHISDGVHPIPGPAADGSGTSAANLIGMAGGRIKMLLTINQRPENGRAAVSWTLESPSLCGYYQEIKTVWNPSLLFHNRNTGADVSARLVDGVLGSLLYKTPISGEITLPSPAADWSVSFIASGYFDQSDMVSPIVENSRWPFDWTNKPDQATLH